MFIRFENQVLQSALVDELHRSAIPFTTDNDGGLRFDGVDEAAVVNAIHKIRDAQFPWYFLKWPLESHSVRFRGVLEESGLPFFVEYHDSGTWFLVRRADQPQLDRLSQTLVDSDDYI
jgi:hypothetical protein